MTLNDTLGLWHRLANAPLPVWSDPEQLFGFFQALRERQELLELALAPLPRGESVLPRVREMFRVAAAPRESRYSDAYFVVRHPEPLAEPDARHIVSSHIQAVLAIAAKAGATDLVEALRSPHVVVASGPAPAPHVSHVHGTDSLIYDTLTDWVCTLTPDPPWVHELQEAFYSAACHYFHAWHLMWPWFAHASEVREPFEPYFSLWTHGVELRFIDDARLCVYLPTADRAPDESGA